MAPNVLIRAVMIPTFLRRPGCARLPLRQYSAASAARNNRSPALAGSSSGSGAAGLSSRDQLATPTLTDNVPAANARPAEIRRRRLHGLAQPRGRPDGLRGPLPGQHNRELVAAVAAGHRRGRHRGGDEAAHLADGVGARQVAVRVVERLQPIDVDHQHRHRRAEDCRFPDYRIQPHLERPQIVQPRQVVGHREAPQSPGVANQPGGHEADRT